MVSLRAEVGRTGYAGGFRLDLRRCRGAELIAAGPANASATATAAAPIKRCMSSSLLLIQFIEITRKLPRRFYDGKGRCDNRSAMNGPVDLTCE